MNQIRPFLMYTAIILFVSSCSMKSPEEILMKTFDEISEIETVEQILETKYFDSANYIFKTDTSAYYFNFSQYNKTFGAKYHCPGNYFSNLRKESKIIYEIAKFQTDQFGRTSYKADRRSEYVSGLIPIYGTVDALKRFLPGILNDTTILIHRLNDTLINAKPSFHLNFELENRVIQPGGKIKEVGIPEDQLRFTYDIYIDQKSYLPTMVKRTSKRRDIYQSGWESTSLRYSFKMIKPKNIYDLTDNPLNFITYSAEDRKIWKEKRLEDLLVNSKAPDWELPDAYGNTYSLKDYEGKLLLLEFTFLGCGGCLRAIPLLNDLNTRYDPEQFALAGINFIHAEDDVIRNHCKEHKIKYLLLSDTGRTALKYKANGAPLFLLIKDGIIVYASEGYNAEKGAEIIEAIERFI